MYENLTCIVCNRPKPPKCLPKVETDTRTVRYRGIWLAQLVRRATRDLGGVSGGPTLGVEPT